ncbi:MAG: HAD family hydrolase, partial [Comamonas sp.]
VQRGPEAAYDAQALFMESVIRPAMKPSAIALVQSHLQAGDMVVITSATNEFVTRPIAQAFGVQELIATELERDGSGWFTGAVKGLPNMREGKVTRMDAWLAARNLSWDTVESTFYSDSMNDVPLLERVNHPVATNPEPRLRALAQERGWRVLDLFTENT